MQSLYSCATFGTFVCMHTMAIWVELYQQPRQAYQIIRNFANTVKSKFRSEIREIHPTGTNIVFIIRKLKFILAQK